MKTYSEVRAWTQCYTDWVEKGIIASLVEQSQIRRSDLSPQQIQNTANIIAVDASTHARISAYYSSTQYFTNGMTVRDWLTGQGFQQQYDFGIFTLKQFGVI